jgi:hypothetical protein
MFPDPYELVLLALASWRTFQLVADDDVFDRSRRWFLRLGSDWNEEGDPVPDAYRVGWAKFLTCPYCFGFWVSIAWWLAWVAVGDWAVALAVPMSISSLLIGLSKILAREEE